MQLRSPLLLALRVLWAVAPLTAGDALARVLDGRSAAVATAASALLWAGWAAALLAMLVPAPVTLTVTRLLTLAGAVVALAALVGDVTVLSALGAVCVVGAAVVAFAPETGIRFVNGAAYPNERRFPLRVPAPLLLGPLVLASAAVVGGPVAAVLLLAARQWVAGVVLAAACIPVVGVLGRAMHGLARRWVVFVPAGLVLHDPMTLADPVLFPRAAIASFGPATEDTTATDLTQRAFGLALELRVHEPAQVALVHPGRRQTDGVTISAALVTPTRPGEVLAEAARRQIGRAATPPPSTRSPW